MSDVLERPRADARAATKLKIVDCDIHPAPYSAKDFLPFLPKRWADYLKTYGGHTRQPFTSTTPYPRIAPLISRRDAWPPTGGPPGSDLDFMRKQHLDPLDIEHGILQVLDMGAMSQPNLEFGAAICSAINDWQRDVWCKPEPRLKASIQVPQEYPEAAIAEIERLAGDPNFVQINMAPRSDQPLGKRRYWPVFEAAVATGLPIGLHVGSWVGGAPTGSGWPSYYAEEHHTNSHTMQALLMSLIMEGIPERFPTLRFVFIEGGFGWVPAMAWRLDKQWARFRDEVPHVRKPPSEYIREQFWFSTQPVEEPEQPEHLRHIMDWIGWDRILFATDYPHWDWDDPRYAFKIQMSDAERRALFRDNAVSLYGF